MIECFVPASQNQEQDKDVNFYFYSLFYWRFYQHNKGNKIFQMDKEEVQLV